MSRGPLSKGVCYAFKNGDCKRGDKCNFIHERAGMNADRAQTMEVRESESEREREELRLCWTRQPL